MKNFCFLFVTGMHLEKEYGYTYEEVSSDFPKNIYTFKNFHRKNSMDEILANTIIGLLKLLRKLIQILLLFTVIELKPLQAQLWVL